MNFELSQLFQIGTAYLLLLFGIAHLADRGIIPERIIRHPITYVLSLGVFTSAWAIYGVVALAQEYGYGFLSYYLGVAGAFIFMPLLLQPLLRITRTNLHSSLADLLTFRYRSQWAGSLITLFMLVAVLPLLALQIQAVSESLFILNEGANQSIKYEHHHQQFAIVFCVVISLFTIFFGSKHVTAHERHNGLVAAIAFESIVKVVAMLVIGFFAINEVFGGLKGLEQWLSENPYMVSQLNNPMRDDSSRALLLIFFSSAVVMPHLFHMIFAEKPNTKALQTASWGIPLFLLLMSLPVLPILWAGRALDTPIATEYFTLAIGLELESTALSLMVYIAGLAAASGAIIVTTLALASMCLKHLILPFYRPSTKRDIYSWLLWIRRLLIIFIILTGYGFFYLIEGDETLSNLGISAFIATLQFLPGVMAALYWQGANRYGFISGLITGFFIWAAAFIIPILSDFSPAFIGKFYFNISYEDLWSAVTIVSIGMNVLVFVTISILTTTSVQEQNAAEACSIDDLSRPTRRTLNVTNPIQMQELLATALGGRTAQREVKLALQELDMPSDESRPFALRRLRQRLEANLSGLMGPSVSHEMVNRLLPYASDEDTSSNKGASSSEDLNLIEIQLETYKLNLTGLAADLDNLRRYHRRTLQDLPVGVCSLGEDGEILMWNSAIAGFTGISTDSVIGSNISNLSAPWGGLLNDFLNTPQAHLYKKRIETAKGSRWINLHKTVINSGNANTDGREIVLEDITDLHMLEDELLHNERLSFIGRLAAGVAHEIGNPITGIACLAQNLRYDTDNPESLETGREILTQTERVSKIVQTLVNFSHAGSEGNKHELAPINIKTCVDEAIHLLHLNRDAKPIDFKNHCPAGISAIADSQRLLQVFVNLLTNARDASPANSPVTVDCDVIDQQVFIHVTDRGSGISQQHQEQIFEPFFTTKEAGEGTGLGLSLVYSIADDFKGHISVKSPAHEVLGGSRFTIRLQNHSSEGIIDEVTNNQ